MTWMQRRELFYSTTYDVAPDGRFVMIELAETEPAIVVVQRWSEQIARLAPPDSAR